MAWLVVFVAAAATADSGCVKEEIPEWFLPVRSDRSCAATILGAIPGEVSKLDINFEDRARIRKRHVGRAPAQQILCG